MTSKINAVIEWLLNDVPLLNKDVKQKLEDKLIANLIYYKDDKGSTLKIRVIDQNE